MALFGGNKEQTTDEQVHESSAHGDQSYFDSMAGEGLENFTQDTVASAYLGMVQPGSTASLTHEPGTWRNSATDENYGTSVELIVLAFQTVWTERSKDPPYLTVGRYQPRGIEVSVEYPKPGTRGFPKMTNPGTGNKVEELFVYACMIRDKPELGILYFSPTVGSMRTCKQWNAQLRSQRLPTGKLAPIHAFAWTLELDLVTNPARPAEKIARFERVKRGDILLKDWHIENVAPQIAAAANVALLAAPETSGDVEE